MRLFLAVIFSIFLGAPVSAATITFYNDYNSYLNECEWQLFGILPDWPTYTTSSGVFPGMVDFNSVGAVTPDLISLALGGLSTVGDPSTPYDTAVLQGILAAPAYAMAMTIASGTIEGLEFYSGESKIGVVSQLIGPGNFVGVISDTPFDRFEFVPHPFFDLGYYRVAISHFRVDVLPSAPTPVPLPASAWLFATGIGLLVLVRRRRQSDC